MCYNDALLQIYTLLINLSLGNFKLCSFFLFCFPLIILSSWHQQCQNTNNNKQQTVIQQPGLKSKLTRVSWHQKRSSYSALGIIVTASVAPISSNYFPPFSMIHMCKSSISCPQPLSMIPWAYLCLTPSACKVTHFFHRIIIIFS